MLCLYWEKQLYYIVMRNITEIKLWTALSYCCLVAVQVVPLPVIAHDVLIVIAGQSEGL